MPHKAHGGALRNDSIPNGLDGFAPIERVRLTPETAPRHGNNINGHVCALCRLFKVAEQMIDSRIGGIADNCANAATGSHQAGGDKRIAIAAGAVVQPFILPSRPDRRQKGGALCQLGDWHQIGRIAVRFAIAIQAVDFIRAWPAQVLAEVNAVFHPPLQQLEAQFVRRAQAVDDNIRALQCQPHAKVAQQLQSLFGPVVAKDDLASLHRHRYSLTNVGHAQFIDILRE